MNAKRRERLLLIAVGLCVLGLALDHLVVGPLWGAWQTRAKRIAELERSIAHGTQLAERERQIAARWSEMVRASAAGAGAQTEDELLNAVSRWASSAGLAVTSIQPRWVENEDDGQQGRKLEVRASINGSMASIARFLYELEADPQALKVEDVAMLARDDAGRTINCDLRFTRLVLDEERDQS